MLHLHTCKVAFILSEEATVDGFKPVSEGDFALHKDYGVVMLAKHENAWMYQRFGYAGHGDDLGNLNPILFKLSQSANGMNAVSVRNPDPVIRAFLVKTMRSTMTGEPGYVTRKAAGAFLQTNCKEEVLIEFWNTDHNAFIQYLNDGLKPWIHEMLEVDLLGYHLENLDS